MDLKKLLLIHAIITFAAGVLLIVAPAIIPETVNIKISSGEYLLCYFLAAAEFGMAYLSFFSRTLNDTSTLQIISKTFIVFHAATGVLELYALSKGLSPIIIGNILFRVVIVGLFYYYGVHKNHKKFLK